MSAPAPLAFVYDRCATRNRRHLDMRLHACHAYVTDLGWVLASRGQWWDTGADALGTHRPALTTMVEAMQEAAGRREVLCLVHSWDRLATDGTHRLMLQQRIISAGGYTLTTFGESDRHTLRAVMAGRVS
ncbi:recombinase family protein [Streptomyces sp. NPDC048506]|uniref:recombinase family protein n=1 Tax=Streptomyces sp. NPDC048506 TaxID=3155028 RepID=UPI00342CDFD7